MHHIISLEMCSDSNFIHIQCHRSQANDIVHRVKKITGYLPSFLHAIQITVSVCLLIVPVTIPRDEFLMPRGYVVVNDTLIGA